MRIFNMSFVILAVMAAFVAEASARGYRRHRGSTSCGRHRYLCGGLRQRATTPPTEPSKAADQDYGYLCETGFEGTNLELLLNSKILSSTENGKVLVSNSSPSGHSVHYGDDYGVVPLPIEVSELESYKTSQTDVTTVCRTIKRKTEPATATP